MINFKKIQKRGWDSMKKRREKKMSKPSSSTRKQCRKNETNKMQKNVPQ